MRAARRIYIDEGSHKVTPVMLHWSNVSAHLSDSLASPGTLMPGICRFGSRRCKPSSPPLRPMPMATPAR